MPDPGWRHHAFESSEYRTPEIVSGGVALLDFDEDGDLDVFAVQSSPWLDLEDQRDQPFPGHGLLRNDGNFQFTDVADQAGVFGRAGPYGTGIVAGDVDGDGDTDVYLTAFGRNTLYRNQWAERGEARFLEVEDAAGAGGADDGFGTSACLFDADRDGLLDLYVCNYVQYTHEFNRRLTCGEDVTGQRDYCSPRVFEGQQDEFYRNDGGDRFVRRTQEAGFTAPQPLSRNAKGLGVIALDVEQDGDPDVYVANDQTANLLFQNDGSGSFTEIALRAGCAYDPNGSAQAGMGVDAGDYDGDGDFDLWVVHIDAETNALYRNDGRGWFTDDNVDAGLSAASVGQVGFGTDFFDADNDGDLDLVIANGHVLRHAERRQTITFAQVDQLFENEGKGRFRLLGAEHAGAYFGEPRVSRGLVSGDLDGDGDLDLVISARDAPLTLLRNRRADADGRSSVILQLESSIGNRAAIGARITLEVGEREWIEEVRCGSSYASCPSPQVHFGVGDADRVRAVVHWPSGHVSSHELAGGHRHRIREGRESVESTPFR